MMKKVISILLAVLMLFALVSCGKDETPDAGTTPNDSIPGQKPDDDRPETPDSKTLVVYFSMPDNVDNSSVVINGEILGNTQYMAYVIQENTGANIFRIVPESPYPTDHDELVDLAKDEQNDNARPKFVGEIENFIEYDTVFVGYPNWWTDMPMILYTFFDTYDFSGKTIIPFNTHGGSGFSSTIATIKSLEPNAEVKDGKSISRNVIADAEQEIIDWIKSLGFEKPATPPESDDNETNLPDTETTTPPDTEKEGKTLVVYYSATGNTERVAGYIANATGGTLFELVPVNPYTSADLNWTVAGSRVNLEHDDVSLRNIELVNTVPENWEEYDIVYIGYPIWWAIAAWPVDNFVKTNDFTGKTVIPFCTAVSSGLGQSGELLAQMAGEGDWLVGKRFSSGVGENEVVEWVNSLTE